MAVTTSVFQGVGGTIDNATAAFVTNVSSDMIATITPWAISGAALYFTLYGYLIIAGKVQQPFGDFLVKSAKIALIGALALNAGNYLALVVETLKGLEAALAAAVGSGGTGTIYGTLDATLGQVIGPEVVEVLVHRLRQFVALFDSFQAGLKHSGQTEVGVAGRVGTADLDVGAFRLAAVGLGNPDQGGTVAPGQRQVDRRFEPRNQPLVGVDPLGVQRRDLAGVPELAGDERLRRLRKRPWLAFVEESVGPIFEQGLMKVHAGPVGPADRLRHEGRVPVLLDRVLLDHDPGRHDVIGGGQGAGRLEVELVL